MDYAITPSWYEVGGSLHGYCLFDLMMQTLDVRDLLSIHRTSAAISSIVPNYQNVISRYTFTVYCWKYNHGLQAILWHLPEKCPIVQNE